MDDTVYFELCPNCGSTKFINDYPIRGKQLCVDCGHEITKIKLKEVALSQEIPEKCPYCERERAEEDALIDDEIARNGAISVLVYRCGTCKNIDGLPIVGDIRQP